MNQLNSQRWVLARVVALCVLALAALLVPKLALPAGLLTLIGYLTLPKLAKPTRRWAVGGIVIAAIASTVAFMSFIVNEAMPGIVAGGRVAVSRSAVSTLREVLFAEDVARQKAFVDPDGDGVGSALWLGELAGNVPLRGGSRLDPPLLQRSYSQVVETRIGPAVSTRGYLFVVCLPTSDGGLTARPEDPIDEERAERRWVGYAWPAADTHAMHQAYYIDEHERILVSPNLEGNEPRYAGPSFPPPCDAAVAESTRGQWTPWRDKKPREKLPGS